jgi:hypothetical protein
VFIVLEFIVFAGNVFAFADVACASCSVVLKLFSKIMGTAVENFQVSISILHVLTVVAILFLSSLFNHNMNSY